MVIKPTPGRHGPIAQWTEQQPSKLWVEGSNTFVTSITSDIIELCISVKLFVRPTLMECK